MKIKKLRDKAYLGEMVEMAIPPKTHTFVLKLSDRDKFIKEMNDNVISKVFLKKCRETSKLFNK